MTDVSMNQYLLNGLLRDNKSRDFIESHKNPKAFYSPKLTDFNALNEDENVPNLLDSAKFIRINGQIVPRQPWHSIASDVIPEHRRFYRENLSSFGPTNLQEHNSLLKARNLTQFLNTAQKVVLNKQAMDAKIVSLEDIQLMENTLASAQAHLLKNPDNEQAQTLFNNTKNALDNIIQLRAEQQLGPVQGADELIAPAQAEAEADAQAEGEGEGDAQAEAEAEAEGEGEGEGEADFNLPNIDQPPLPLADADMALFDALPDAPGGDNVVDNTPGAIPVEDNGNIVPVPPQAVPLTPPQQQNIASGVVHFNIRQGDVQPGDFVVLSDNYTGNANIRIPSGATKILYEVSQVRLNGNQVQLVWIKQLNGNVLHQTLRFEPVNIIEINQGNIQPDTSIRLSNVSFLSYDSRHDFIQRYHVV
jgi:hypothetical protein